MWQSCITSLTSCNAETVPAGWRQVFDTIHSLSHPSVRTTRKLTIHSLSHPSVRTTWKLSSCRRIFEVWKYRKDVTSVTLQPCSCRQCLWARQETGSLGEFPYSDAILSVDDVVRGTILMHILNYQLLNRSMTVVRKQKGNFFLFTTVAAE